MKVLAETKLLLLVAVAHLVTLPAGAQFGSDAFSASTEFGRPYVYELEDKVGKFWHPPKGKKWQDLVVDFKVRKNGSITGLKTSHSSGLTNIDRLAMQAIRQAAPFPSLPTESSVAAFRLHFESPQPIQHEIAPQTQKNSVSPTSEVTNTSEGRPSVAAQRDVDFGPYMADLQIRVKRAWKAVARSQPKSAVVIFKVHTGGEISHLRIDRSSGDAKVDEIAMDAIKTASPFRRLPDGAPDDVDIQFTFDQAGPFGFKKSGDAWVGWIHGGHYRGHFREF